MTPELIGLLLKAPVALRLALLDAAPNGAGWMAYPEPDGIEPSADLYQRRGDDSSRRIVEGGAAFLPCNPLAIVEHAAKLQFGASFVAALDSQPGNGYCAAVLRELPVDLQAVGTKAFGECPYTAAVALLRLVVCP